MPDHSDSRDLSAAYDYARKAEQEGRSDQIYEDARASLGEKVSNERQQLQQKYKKQRKERQTSKRRNMLLAGIAAAAGVIIVLAVTLGANNKPPAAAEDAQGAAATAVQTVEASTPEPTAESVSSAEAVSAVEPQDETTEQENNTVQSFHGYTLGETVRYTGTVHYKTSETDELSGPATAGLAMISAINPNGRHPFHLVHVDDASDVYGWVDESFLEPAS